MTAQTRSAPIHLSSVSDGQNEHDKLGLLDLVNDAVISHPDPKQIGQAINSHAQPSPQLSESAIRTDSPWRVIRVIRGSILHSDNSRLYCFLPQASSVFCHAKSLLHATRVVCSYALMQRQSLVSPSNHLSPNDTAHRKKLFNRPRPSLPLPLATKAVALQFRSSPRTSPSGLAASQLASRLAHFSLSLIRTCFGFRSASIPPLLPLSSPLSLVLV
jgi:hypothetical protein